MVTKVKTQEAGFGKDNDYSLVEQSAIFRAKRKKRKSSSRPGRYRCVACKKPIFHIWSYETREVYADWFPDEKTKRLTCTLDDCGSVPQGGVDVHHLCPCGTELTKSFDVVVAIIEGRHIDLSSTNVIEEVKKVK